MSESKIIVPNSTPAQPTKVAPLRPEQTEQIVLGLKRYLELGQSSILESNAAAERRGLEDFLKTSLLSHAGEFIGCWYAVRQEYEPLCVCIANLLQRVEAFRERHREAATPAQPVDNTGASLITTSPTKDVVRE
jgi:hypothetical protein